MVKKFFLKSIILFLIISCILYSIAPILVKPWYHAKMNQGLYNTDEYFDVVLLGSSHMNGLIDPDVLSEKCNLNAFNYGSGGQPINVTYYLLKEILNNHECPKLVVLDVYYLGLLNEYGEDSYIRYVLDNFKFSKNKIDAINNCVPFNERISYIFPIFKYHNRWNQLTESDYILNSDFDTSINGFEAGDDQYGLDLASNQYSSDIGEIPYSSEQYLLKIIELSKEYNFQLIFVNAPYDYTSNDSITTWYYDDAAMMNKIEEIAADYDIPFINYSSIDKMDSINFDFKSDMNNIGHVNKSGAAKVSSDFANFINENYDL